jgi:FtsP/CotA-like multicopper oxidase with cupredoxin domain
VNVAIADSVRDSRLPGSYDMVGEAVEGPGGHSTGAAGHGAHVAAEKVRSVADLTGPTGEIPDVKVALVARRAILTIDGHRQQALTYNGISPGPLLRVKRGQLLEVSLHNLDIADGVTIHWHGIEVPNAQDGVAGVTQNAVRPGETYTYRFRPVRAGTFWYHSHQASASQVAGGLYGVLIVDPDTPADPAGTLDMEAAIHSWDGVNTVNADTGYRQDVKPGRTVRVRLVNTDDWPTRFVISGVPFRVVSVDGNPVHEPGEVLGQGLLVGAGGRNDITFVMPAGPVTVTAQVDAVRRTAAGRGIADPAITFSADGHVRETTTEHPAKDLDLAAYGAPAATPFGSGSQFDQSITFYLDYMFFGFYDGRLSTTSSINGKLFPAAPMLLVRDGDLVRVTFVNRSMDDHPMHLHGHTMLVLSRDGRTVTGSPWWADTLNVAPGETYEVAFRADNPGVWMDHCHNLGHASRGMMMDLSYVGVTDPFRAGVTTGNDPD